MLLIDQKIFRKAQKGIKNCPLNLFIFLCLQKVSLNAQNIFEHKSQYLNQEFMSINSSLFIEDKFLKLINKGFLRREVDGQELTSEVLIKPIERLIIGKCTDLFTKKAFLQ